MKSDARYFDEEGEPITAVEDHRLRMEQLRDAMAGQPSEKFAEHSKVLRDWHWTTWNGTPYWEAGALALVMDEYSRVMVEQLNRPSIFAFVDQERCARAVVPPRDMDWAPE